jgi:hypothetical protein
VSTGRLVVGSALSLLALALTACGGGAGASPFGPAPAAAAAPHITSIQLFGDSTQFLAGSYWQQHYPGLVVDNQAVPGTSTAQLLAGTDGKHAAWPTPVSADVAVFKFGANDALPWFNTSIAQFKANLRALVAGVKGVAVLETPDPTLDPARPNEPAYTQAVRDVAAELHVALIDTDACWRAYGNWQSFIGPDGEHATEAGRAYTVTNCVAPVIDALLANTGSAS